ncbi:acyltransferase [Bradyrhizobium xenonodulans]|uniref:Acyltransferase n=1 Tax=Bradyrhizobium xenonodulans TaxID=2736875 RepID=A0ABY7MPK9_9BRAD|nr:acyltransferase [Bradyrhizobium xenonodulans]WBL80317.1 acyltransferase [Bradyrhizobium xenonodulans]
MTQRIAGFDGLRAIAVLMVLAEHKLPFANKFALGGYGVHLFFVLSGFLVIGILHRARGAIESGASTFRREIVRFYENRAFRIWPIYYLTVALIAAYGFIGGRPQLRGDEIFSLLTMTSNIFQSYVWPNYPTHFGAFWSVAIEEQFYLWAAIAFLLTPQIHAWKICVFVIAIGVLFGVVSFVLGLPGRSIYTGSLTNFGLMALGGLARMRWKRRGRLAAPALLLYLLCPIIEWWWAPPQGAGLLLFFGSGILVAILLSEIIANQSSLLVRLLELPPLKYVGRISYGLYIFHGFFGLALLGNYAPVLRQSYSGIIDIAISIGIASLSWQYIEAPLLALRDRIRTRRVRATVTPRAVAAE